MLIAHYAEAIQPTLTRLKPDSMRLMADLVIRRNQLLTMQTMEKNRLQIMPRQLTMSIKPILTAFKKQIEKIENTIVKLIENCPEYQVKNEILQSMPGIGKIAAHQSLATFLSSAKSPTSKLPPLSVSPP